MRQPAVLLATILSYGLILSYSSAMLPTQQESSSLFDIQLYLDLQFVNETLAKDLESLDDSNRNVVHFCSAIQSQIDGRIVSEAALEYNSTILSQDCEIVATGRVYDREAEDVFGKGYFSLQVHVSQKVVVVESNNQTLYLEVVQSIVQQGFDVVSGGQREFRNQLYEQNDLFRSVLSVKLRTGLWVWPTMSPTQRPTAAPTLRPTQRPTAAPTLRPTEIPPTQKPTERPSQRPTQSPTQRPTISPSWSPSEYPTKQSSETPSESPTNMPSVGPSQTPSRTPSTMPSTIPSSALTIAITLKTSAATTLSGNLVWTVAILGALGIVASISLMTAWCCYLHRKRSRKHYQRRPPKLPLSHHHHGPFIPGIVEFGETSLGETTLGDPQGLALGSSFDENSLFTTPFSIEPEERAMAILPPPSIQSSSLSSHLMIPLEYEDCVVFPASDSDEERSAETPKTDRITSIRPHHDLWRLGGSLSDDFSLIPSDLDVWSCDLEPEDTISSSTSKVRNGTLPFSKEEGHKTNHSALELKPTAQKGLLDFDQGWERWKSPPPNAFSQKRPNAIVSPASPTSSKETTLSRASRKTNIGTPTFDSFSTGIVNFFDRMSIPKIALEDKTEERCEHMEAPKVENKIPKLLRNESDDDSGVSASPWLMEKIENTLGPKSLSADLVSMSGKSQRSKSKLGRKNGTEVSYSSSSSTYSRFSTRDVASLMSAVSSTMSTDILTQKQPKEISFVRRTFEKSAIEGRKKELELQLAALDEKENDETASSVAVSSITYGSYSTISAKSWKGRNRKKIMVVVPSGRLSVTLADRHDGNGTVIASIKNESPVKGTLKPGDRLIAVDEVAVDKMSCSQITSLIASRTDRERRFTILTRTFHPNK